MDNPGNLQNVWPDICCCSPHPVEVEIRRCVKSFFENMDTDEEKARYKEKRRVAPIALVLALKCSLMVMQILASAHVVYRCLATDAHLGHD